MYVHLELRICWGHALCMACAPTITSCVCVDLICSKMFGFDIQFPEGLWSNAGAQNPQRCNKQRIRRSSYLITPQQMTLSPGRGSINAAWQDHTRIHTHTHFILLNNKRQHTRKQLNNTASVPKRGNCDTDLCVMDVISSVRGVVLAAGLDAMLQ